MAHSSSDEDDVPLALLQQSIDDGGSDDEFDDLTLVHFVGEPFQMVNCERDRDNQHDIQTGWSTEDGDGPMIAPFTGDSKLNVDLPAQATPLDFFNLFFEPDMWDMMVQQTNNYAEEKIRNLTPNLKPHSRIKKWEPVTVPQMKMFVAISLSFGLTRKPDLDLYWSTDPYIETPIYGKLMSRDKYFLILSNFHLVPPQPPVQDTAYPDPLYKLRPFITMIQRKFSDVYTPGRDLSFDEGTCPWKGRLKFKVYNPAKPNKFGIKLYQVSESLSGYILGFDIYSGKTDFTGGSPEEFADLVGVNPEATVTTKLVVGLLARCGLLDEGRHVYMDNYYTSPELFTELDVRNTYACGTVRKNRRDVPKAFPEVKLKQGEVIFRRKDNILALKWHDKRDIHMLSTIHRPFWKNVRGHRDRVVAKPVMVLEYVSYMGGVDLSDQLVQYYSCLRKTVKWWRKLFFHLLELVGVNAYTMYVKYGTGPRMSHYDFMRSLVARLVEESVSNCPTPPPQRRRAGEDPPTRIRDKHFADYHPAKPGAKRAKPVRDCYACNPRKNLRNGFKRRQSSFWCPECERTLCFPVCFRIFHSYTDYRRRLAAIYGVETGSDSDSD
jgi:hypothetical protein